MKYRTEHIDGVSLIFPEETGLPIRLLASILSTAPKDSVIDLGLAGRVGAMFAVGLPKDLEAYRKTMPAVGPKIAAEVELADQKYQGSDAQEIKSYLEGYDRGLSADALLQATSELSVAQNPMACPSDSDDLGRCLRLYKSCSVVRLNFAQARVFDSWPAKLKVLWNQETAHLPAVHPGPYPPVGWRVGQWPTTGLVAQSGQ